MYQLELEILIDVIHYKGGKDMTAINHPGIYIVGKRKPTTKPSPALTMKEIAEAIKIAEKYTKKK